MLTDREIQLLKAKLKRLTNLYWRDADGVAHLVKGVNLKWVEDKNEPDLAEPVAVLASGKVVALHNVELSEFVTLQPISLGHPNEPTLYVDRVIETLAMLCYGAKPPRKMVEEWFRDESEELQDWAVNHSSMYWATGIGTIEAAIAMAETPEEGISGGNGPEHQMREEAFPREVSFVEEEPAPTTSLEHLKRAFDLSGIVYTVREDEDGFAYLFSGDTLTDAQVMGEYTADTMPLELLRQMRLRLYEFEDGYLISC